MTDSPPHDRRGLTNGIPPQHRGGASSAVGTGNGTRGRTNGLINGALAIGARRRGGFVNGAGYTNGLRFRRNAFGFVTQSDLRRSGALIAVSFALMLLLAYFLGAPVGPSGPAFAIDGVFTEWTNVTVYGDPQDAPLAEADLIAYGIHAADGQLFVYGQTRGPAFPGSTPSSVYLIIDHPDTSGYEGPGLEADFVAEVYGWNGSVGGTIIREWTGTTDRHNATPFLNVRGFPAISVGQEFEFVLEESEFGPAPSANLRMMMATQSGLATDEGAIVGRTPGALVVTQRPLTDIVTAATFLLELRLQALNADIRVDSIVVRQTGGGTVTLPPLPFTIGSGQERVLQLVLNPGGASPGTLITVEVVGINATAVGSGASVSPTLSGDGARAYVQATPAGKVVDGLFTDWIGTPNDPDDVLPDSVDIRDAAWAIGSRAFFYVRTEGRALDGAFLPEVRVLPQPAGPPLPSPPAPVRRQSGEDILRIFVDTDNRDTVGDPMAGLVADRFIEVRGRYGQITSKTLYRWNAVTWTWDLRSDTFDIALVGTQFEAAPAPSFLVPTNYTEILFAATDWSARGDTSDILGILGTRAAAASPEPLHGLFAQSIFAAPLLNIPTVDGRCRIGAGEYAGASSRTFIELRFFVGRRDDSQFVFICIEVFADLTPNINDFGEILFDTKHDGGGTPQPDDRLFWVTSNSAAIGSAEGDGLTWILCTVCDPGDAAEGRFNPGIGETYEFQIRYTDVWATLTPPDNAVAGFMLAVWDQDANGGLGAAYGWGSSNLNDSVPDTWGHIFLPEFPTVAFAIGGAILIPLMRRWTSSRKSSSARASVEGLPPSDKS